MELIKVELSEFTRRSRSFAATHAETGASRGLEHGERVLVLDRGEYRTAVVADVEFDLHETHYRFILGGHVPAEVAEHRLVGEINVHPRSTSGRVSVHDVADLLARSGAAHRIPMQRQVARRLLER